MDIILVNLKLLYCCLVSLL